MNPTHSFDAERDLLRAMAKVPPTLRKMPPLFNFLHIIKIKDACIHSPG
jgi:hypothetical protein